MSYSVPVTGLVFLCSVVIWENGINSELVAAV